MPATLFWALAVFAFVTSVTPGPNNMMLLTSGVNFGFRRTIPHALGVALGFTLMVAIVGLGLAGIFARFPVLLVAMKWVGAAYMVYLAVKLARAAPIRDGAAAGRPMTFLQAAAFQWINPKAWIMALTAVATYTLPERYTFTVAIVALVFGAINLPSVSSWVLFGSALRRALADPRVLRIFNWTMAVLLIASIVPALWE
ncbi:MAG TPA: LysE family translocator [Lichenihabitans sp.]|jgi:threonine/homoserine/homoserine lactone efflux protein|nr:LysE family translocator [Lichenihabitans sp.]